MGILYRLRQFVRAARPQSPPDLGALGGLLTAQQRALFDAMAPVDQRHCLAVARALAAEGYSQPDMLRAALIHDAGKATARIALWERVAHVLLSRFAPSAAGRVGSPQAGGFGHGLFVLAHHAALSAGLAEQAGFPPATIGLLRGEGDADLLDALRRADDTN